MHALSQSRQGDSSRSAWRRQVLAAVGVPRAAMMGTDDEAGQAQVGVLGESAESGGVRHLSVLPAGDTALGYAGQGGPSGLCGGSAGGS